MKSKLLHLIWTVLILFSGTVAFGQWTVYDGSVLPEDATPAWTKAQSTAGVSSVVDDPVLTGNKLLLIQDLS